MSDTADKNIQHLQELADQALGRGKISFSDDPEEIARSVRAEAEDDPALSQAVAEASALFDEMCTARHEYGQEKYGEFTFVEAPTLQMALEEVVDLANYARYTFIKVWLLRNAIARAQVTSMQKAGGSTGGFISTRDIMGVKEG
jgi:hypothetical protein